MRVYTERILLHETHQNPEGKMRINEYSFLNGDSQKNKLQLLIRWLL